ncbi:hypothetical protein VTL71DRAFT_7118 [Oculimacula yallundae]|uniref:Uncharacterized protein n=1 Tax=Oculimacula yallundae TaxID=86028 RepID=A0ABR4BVU3_9HELO
MHLPSFSMSVGSSAIQSHRQRSVSAFGDRDLQPKGGHGQPASRASQLPIDVINRSSRFMSLRPTAASAEACHHVRYRWQAGPRLGLFDVTVKEAALQILNLLIVVYCRILWIRIFPGRNTMALFVTSMSHQAHTTEDYNQ